MSLHRISLEELPGPSRLPRYRTERYIGDENAVALKELPARDADVLGDLYQLLKDTLETANTAIRDERPEWMLRRIKESRFVDRVQEFTRGFTTESVTDEGLRARLRKVYHDARGGALNAAVGMSQLLELKGNEVELGDVYGVFNAVRDHLKIMRNCFLDLDPERRRRDLAFNAHSARLFRQKWEGYQDTGVEIEYIADFDGDISSSCLEFSSVERAIYNLVNNAMNHTADGLVRLYVKGVHQARPQAGTTGSTRGSAGDEPPPAQPADHPKDVRIATANAVDSDEAERLRTRFGENLSELFMGGFTIGGSGVGLSICTELVSNAYGLAQYHDAIEGGYVGADILRDQFVAWIHWPTLQ